MTANDLHKVTLENNKKTKNQLSQNFFENELFINYYHLRKIKLTESKQCLIYLTIFSLLIAMLFYSLKKFQIKTNTDNENSLLHKTGNEPFSKLIIKKITTYNHININKLQT